MSSPPPDGFDDDATRAAVKELNALFDEWCERPRCARVRASDVIPDLTNRENTGVSLEHAHGIATSMTRDGFDPQHEVPVVVRESARALLASPAYDRWRAFTEHNAAVLPPLADFSGRAHAFTTLGSSHLNLALRLVQTDTPSVFGRGVRYGPALERDAKLRDAILEGLPSVVLRADTPPAIRRRVSLALNNAALLGFRVDPIAGDARPDPRGSAASDDLTLFQSLARTLDSEELSSLARIGRARARDGAARVQERRRRGRGRGTRGEGQGTREAVNRSENRGGMDDVFREGGWIRDERARAGRRGRGG